MARQRQKLIPESEEWVLPCGTSRFTISPEKGATAIMKADGDDINIYDDEAYNSDARGNDITGVRIEASGGNIRVIYFF